MVPETIPALSTARVRRCRCRTMHIITAAHLDKDAVRSVHLCAFPENERDSVARLALDLLAETTGPPVLSLAAHYDGTIIGHIAFSPVKIDSGEDLRGYILAPLGVRPEQQKHGIGSQLVQHGMRVLAGNGVHILFVYGDPAYYSRFGFNAETAAPFTAPYTLHYPFGWQAAVLNEHETPRSPATITCVHALCDQKLW